MHRLAIEIGVVIVVFLIGYRMGFIACYDYLKEKLDEEKRKAWIGFIKEKKTNHQINK